MNGSRLQLATPRTGVRLFQFIPAEAQLLFALIDRNRQHLSQHGDKTASKYPDFESVVQSITNPVDPNKIRFGIWSNGELTGTVNLTPMGDHTAEIGYWIGSEFCRQGLATLATMSIVSFARHCRNLDRLIAVIDIRNLASQGVLRRAGMVEYRRSETDVWFVVNV